MDEDKLVVRGFSITKNEVGILERVSKDRSLFNLSAALRQIIREWDDAVTRERIQITDVGREALEATRKEE